METDLNTHTSGKAASSSIGLDLPQDSTEEGSSQIHSLEVKIEKDTLENRFSDETSGNSKMNLNLSLNSESDEKLSEPMELCDPNCNTNPEQEKIVGEAGDKDSFISQSPIEHRDMTEPHSDPAKLQEEQVNEKPVDFDEMFTRAKEKMKEFLSSLSEEGIMEFLDKVCYPIEDYGKFDNQTTTGSALSDPDGDTSTEVPLYGAALIERQIELNLINPEEFELKKLVDDDIAIGELIERLMNTGIKIDPRDGFPENYSKKEATGLATNADINEKVEEIAGRNMKPVEDLSNSLVTSEIQLKTASSLSESDISETNRLEFQPGSCSGEKLSEPMELCDPNCNTNSEQAKIVGEAGDKYSFISQSPIEHRNMTESHRDTAKLQEDFEQARIAQEAEDRELLARATVQLYPLNLDGELDEDTTDFLKSWARAEKQMEKYIRDLGPDVKVETLNGFHRLQEYCSNSSGTLDTSDEELETGSILSDFSASDIVYETKRGRFEGQNYEDTVKNRLLLSAESPRPSNINSNLMLNSFLDDTLSQTGKSSKPNCNADSEVSYDDGLISNAKETINKMLNSIDPDELVEHFASILNPARDCPGSSITSEIELKRSSLSGESPRPSKMNSNLPSGPDESLAQTAEASKPTCNADSEVPFEEDGLSSRAKEKINELLNSIDPDELVQHFTSIFNPARVGPGSSITSDVEIKRLLLSDDFPRPSKMNSNLPSGPDENLAGTAESSNPNCNLDSEIPFDNEVISRAKETIKKMLSDLDPDEKVEHFTSIFNPVEDHLDASVASDSSEIELKRLFPRDDSPSPLKMDSNWPLNSGPGESLAQTEESSNPNCDVDSEVPFEEDGLSSRAKETINELLNSIDPDELVQHFTSIFNPARVGPGSSITSDVEIKRLLLSDDFPRPSKMNSNLPSGPDENLAGTAESSHPNCNLDSEIPFDNEVISRAKETIKKMLSDLDPDEKVEHFTSIFNNSEDCLGSSITSDVEIKRSSLSGESPRPEINSKLLLNSGSNKNLSKTAKSSKPNCKTGSEAANNVGNLAAKKSEIEGYEEEPIRGLLKLKTEPIIGLPHAFLKQKAKSLAKNRDQQEEAEKIHRSRKSSEARPSTSADSKTPTIPELRRKELERTIGNYFPGTTKSQLSKICRSLNALYRWREYINRTHHSLNCPPKILKPNRMYSPKTELGKKNLLEIEAAEKAAEDEMLRRIRSYSPASIWPYKSQWSLSTFEDTVRECKKRDVKSSEKNRTSNKSKVTNSKITPLERKNRVEDKLIQQKKEQEKQGKKRRNEITVTNPKTTRNKRKAEEETASNALPAKVEESISTPKKKKMKEVPKKKEPNPRKSYSLRGLVPKPHQQQPQPPQQQPQPTFHVGWSCKSGPLIPAHLSTPLQTFPIKQSSSESQTLSSSAIVEEQGETVEKKLTTEKRPIVTKAAMKALPEKLQKKYDDDVSQSLDCVSETKLIVKVPTFRPLSEIFKPEDDNKTSQVSLPRNPQTKKSILVATFSGINIHLKDLYVYGYLGEHGYESADRFKTIAYEQGVSKEMENYICFEKNEKFISTLGTIRERREAVRRINHNELRKMFEQLMVRAMKLEKCVVRDYFKIISGVWGKRIAIFNHFFDKDCVSKKDYKEKSKPMHGIILERENKKTFAILTLMNIQAEEQAMMSKTNEK